MTLISQACCDPGCDSFAGGARDCKREGGGRGGRAGGRVAECARVRGGPVGVRLRVEVLVGGRLRTSAIPPHRANASYAAVLSSKMKNAVFFAKSGRLSLGFSNENLKPEQTKGTAMHGNCWKSFLAKNGIKRYKTVQNGINDLRFQLYRFI